jgi:hypothetical protein
MECKRYGCMKNLLACYANCRYNGRCDDLRNEVIANADQAASDINDYLRERGRPPITIQVMKRGLKFPSSTRLQKSLQESSPLAQIKPVDSNVSGKAKKASSNPSALIADRPRSKRKKRAAASAVRTTTSKQVSGLATREPAKADKPRPVERRKKVGPRRKKRITMARNTSREEGVRKQEKIETHNQTAEATQPAAAAKSARSRNGSNRKAKSASKSALPAGKNGKVFIILEGKSASLVDEQGLIAHLLANHSSGARYFEASEVEARLQIVPKR